MLQNALWLRLYFLYQSGDVFAVVTDGFTDQIGRTNG